VKRSVDKLNWIGWSDFRIEPNFAAAPAASKMAQIKK